MSAELSNNGLTILNPAEPGSESTIIAVGVPRSGTSMIGSVLYGLGVPLGDKADRAVFEDVEIATAIESGAAAALEKLIEERNAKHSVWGFKRPMAFLNLADHLHRFRNPRVIATFRDPAAIAKRNEISMALPFFDVLEKAAETTSLLIASIRKLPCPIFVVSYEKSLSDPQTFLGELVKFCGIRPSESQMQAALAAIQNGPDAYVRSSRVWYEGAFDGAGRQVARGWARRMPMNSACTIEIWDDGRCIGKGRADRPRADLSKIGDRAFEVRLSSEPGISVEARVSGTTVVLPRTKAFKVS